MPTFAVVANHPTPTNARLGRLLAPGQAVVRLRAGDIALGRIDVLASLDGIEPGAWALEALERRGVSVLNTRAGLTRAHDKLATAEALALAALPHPETQHVAPWLPLPALAPPLVLKPRYGSWGRDVYRCDSADGLEQALGEVSSRVWFARTGGVVQPLVPPAGFDLRIVVAGGRVIGAIRRIAPSGEWRTNVALGARRAPTVPSAEACELALAAAEAVGGDLVGVDLLPAEGGGWTILEVNGAVEFTGAYSLGAEVFSAACTALAGALRRRARPEPGSTSPPLVPALARGRA